MIKLSRRYMKLHKHAFVSKNLFQQIIQQSINGFLTVLEQPYGKSDKR